MADAVGIHLLAHRDLRDSPRRSVVAALDPAGRLTALDDVCADDTIAAAAAAREPGVVAVDAPLAIPNTTGRRDVETVLSWLDVAALPVSQRRVETIFGEARGVGLAPTLAAPGRRVLEALPDQVLRQLAREGGGPPSAEPGDLATYRAAWIATRAPVYRPKGAGRARPAGTRAAWALLSGAVDTGGWAPAAAPADDWEAIADAARIDAICCALAALRLADPARSALVGAPGRGEVALAADADLRARLDATLARLRAEGAIGI